MERLNRLREAGVLSDSEFEQQKQSILTGQTASRVPRQALLGGAAIVAVIGVAILAFFLNPNGDPVDASASALPPVESSIISQSEPPVPIASASPEAAPAISAHDRLSFATSDEVIGSNPPISKSDLVCRGKKALVIWHSNSAVAPCIIGLREAASPVSPLM
ncbi:SHOCT domain-containing protein [Alteripontixanthobacter maritimus]|uniref:SHOCT domain-containing protein n=1 Tax=Alteripontixanthobacter maritimus TaxID=2161824 RepID=UPI000E1BCAAE